MTKCSDICKHIEQFCPKKIAEEWDNVGLLVGNPDAEVRKVLVALDATEAVIKEAIHDKADIIVTHHPLFIPRFMGPIKNVTTETSVGKAIISLIKNNISLYCAHTNLDIAEGGVNDVLTQLLGFENIKLLEPTLENENGSFGIGRVGEFTNDIELYELAKVVKNKLRIDSIRIVGDAKARIQKAAICSGSGMSLLTQAAAQKVDVFITGDVKYHEAQEAIAQGINIIDAGHYQSENIIVPVLKKYIEKIESIEVLESRVDGNPFKVL